MSEPVSMQELYAVEADVEKETMASTNPSVLTGRYNVKFPVVSAVRRDDDSVLWPGRLMITPKVLVIDENGEGPTVSWFEDMSPEYREDDRKRGLPDKPYMLYSLYKAAHGIHNANAGEVVEHMKEHVTSWVVLLTANVDGKFEVVRDEQRLSELTKNGVVPRNRLAGQPGSASAPKTE